MSHLGHLIWILSDLNQAVPNPLPDESQTHLPDTPPDHLQKKMADDAPSPALPRSSTGSKFPDPIGDGKCPTASNPVRELIQRGSKTKNRMKEELKR